MSCFLLYLGHGSALRAAPAPHAARRPRLPALHRRRHAPRAAAGRRSRPTSTRPRGPSRAWRAPAGTRSRRCCPSRTSAAGVDWAREADGLRDALVARPREDLRPGGARRQRRRRAPHDARWTSATSSGAVDGNAFAVEPTLHQSAWLPPAQPRPRGAPGCTTSAAGRTRAPASRACCSGPRSRPGWSPGPPRPRAGGARDAGG